MLREEGMGGYCLMGTELQFCKKKRVPWMYGGVVAQQCECTQYHQTMNLKRVMMVNFVCVFYHK